MACVADGVAVLRIAAAGGSSPMGYEITGWLIIVEILPSEDAGLRRSRVSDLIHFLA